MKKDKLCTQFEYCRYTKSDFCRYKKGYENCLIFQTLSKSEDEYLGIGAADKETTKDLNKDLEDLIRKLNTGDY